MVQKLGKKYNGFDVKILYHSVKFYLPRVEGYLEIIRKMSSEYNGMSLIEFDGYFEGKFEPVKYMRVEIHTGRINKIKLLNYANSIRKRLKQKSLAIEFDNSLILINESN